MKSLVIHGKEDIRWEDREAPEPREGQVRLRVNYMGICGSDLHYYFQGANGEYTIREPLTPGHELSGVVDLDPSGRLAPGTPVTVHPGRYGPAVPGLEDRPHLRPGGDYLGSAASNPHRQGGASELLIVEEHMVRALPDTLPLERAALAEPLAVALHAVSLSGDITGKRVLVIGAGPIGLLVVAAAVHAGAGVVGASDVRPEPLDRAQALGATEVALVGRDAIDDESYDVVFECSGVGVALSQAVRGATCRHRSPDRDAPEHRHQREPGADAGEGAHDSRRLPLLDRDRRRRPDARRVGCARPRRVARHPGIRRGPRVRDRPRLVRLRQGPPVSLTPPALPALPCAHHYEGVIR